MPNKDKLSPSKRLADAIAAEPKTVVEFLRNVDGLSREAAAEKAGLSESRLHWIESGAAVVVTDEEKKALSQAFRCDADLLTQRPTAAARDAALVRRLA